MPSYSPSHLADHILLRDTTACPARTRLELDDMDPVGRGAKATAERMRLRCRAHNQYAAERVYGAGFMERKREEARRRARLV